MLCRTGKTPLEAARLFGLRRSSISRLILQANSGISASGVIEPVFTVSNNHMILDWPFGPKIIPAFGPVLSERRLAVGSEDRACMILILRWGRCWRRMSRR